MERKTTAKATPSTAPSTTSSKDALKSRVLPNQKPTTKPFNPSAYNHSGKKYSRASEEGLLTESTRKVNQLFSKTLPAIPHFISVPTLHERSETPPHLSVHPLFKADEGIETQYTTLINCAERGTILVRPGWALDEKAISPASSGSKFSRTPNGYAEGKKPEYKTKIKFGDYAKLGKTVAAREDTLTTKEATNLHNSGLAKSYKGYVEQASCFSVTDKSSGMVSSKDGRSETPVNASNGKEVNIKTESKTEAKSAPERPPNRSVKAVASEENTWRRIGDSTYPEALRPAKNDAEKVAGTGRDPEKAETKSQSKAQSNGNDSKAHTEASHDKTHTKRPLPDCEITSPVAKKFKVEPNLSNAKRSLAEQDSSPAPKKAKLSNGVQSKDTKENKASSQPSSSQTSQVNGKKESAPKQSIEGAKKGAAPKANAAQPSKPTPIHTDKPPGSKGLPPLLSPTLPPEVKPRLPRLLSPTLPPEVVAALPEYYSRKAAAKEAKEAKDPPTNGEKQKKTIDTVADRHEKSRQPNAPGIARKVVKNSKQRQENEVAESSSTAQKEQPSLTIKLRYKRKQRKDIERILRLRPDPDRTTVVEPADTGSTRSKPVVEDSQHRDARRSSEEKVRPSERNGASKRPPPSSSSTAAQKRPRQAEPQQANNKRLKPSDHVAPAKPSTPQTPAFNPPAISAASSSQKGVSDTPRKNDSMRGVALARVNSTSGIARTPQVIAGSSERSTNAPRINSFLEYREKPHTISVSLKREMDRLHKIKEGGLGHVSPNERKLGIVVGLECSLTYMAQFETAREARSAAQDWLDLLRLHQYIEHQVRDIPMLDIVSVQIKLVARHRYNSALASVGFKGVDLAVVAENITCQDQLWKELDQKMSNERVQAVEESFTKGRGFNPNGNFKQFIALSLAKLRRYAEREGIQWDQKLAFVD